MNLTLRQLRAFTAVVEAGSFTGAAAALHLTPSALSVLVRELEAVLGARLFDRHTRRVLLAAAGRELLPHAQRVLAEVAAATTSVSELRHKQRGRLRLAAPQMMASTLIATAIAAYRLQHPAIEITLEDTLTDQLVERVASGAVEIAVGVEVLAVAGGAELARRTLFRDRHWLVCRPDHPFAARRQVRWKDLVAEPFLAPTRDFTKWLQPVLAPLGLMPSAVHVSSYMTTALGLAAAGLGVTAIPTYGAPLLDAWGLVLKPLVAPVFERDVQIYSLPGRDLSPAAAAFVELLETSVTSPPRQRRAASAAPGRRQR